jgi:hypothetical protein
MDKTLEIRDLTITKGNADDGGGIYNDHGTVNVVNGALSDNISAIRAWRPKAA